MFERRTNKLRQPAGRADAIAVARISLLLLLAGAIAVVGTAPPAVAGAAAPADPGGFHFSQPHYFVDENAGRAVITVERADTAKGAVVRFHTIGRTPKLMDNAESPWYFRSVKSGVNAPNLTFAPGQASATFTIPIVDHGFNSVPVHLGISLYGPFPIGLTKRRAFG